jgi:acetyl-CoA acetyltransferase
MVMRRYMHEYGATLDHFGKIAVAGRYHASLNPLAYLRKPITVQDYKESRLVADPVRLLDCVMPPTVAELTSLRLQSAPNRCAKNRFT